LPTHAATSTEEWKRAMMPDGHSVAPIRGGPAIQLMRLTRHLPESLKCKQRALGESGIHGVAQVGGNRADFSGEYLRDLGSAAAWEARLYTVCLPP
jgi:hypothetical protein